MLFSSVEHSSLGPRSLLSWKVISVSVFEFYFLLFMLKDDKLQNILGHFKKDFEGDFSAENLGMLHAWQQLFFFFVWGHKV